MATEKEKIGVYKILNKDSSNFPIYDNLWEYNINLFEKDLEAKTKYDNSNFLFEKEFNSDYSSFITSYLQSEKLIINLISNHSLIKEASQNKVIITGKVKELVENGNKKYISGHSYISIDLCSSYAQLFDNLFCFGMTKWEDYKKILIPYELIWSSKAFFMNSLNKVPSYYNFKERAFILLNKMLENKSDELLSLISEENLPFAVYLVDELVWDITGKEEKFKKFIGDREINGIKVHVTEFVYNKCSYTFKNELKNINIKDFLDSDKCKYQTTFNDFLPQIYKCYHNLPIEDNDLYYFDLLYNNKFDEEIKNFKILKE